MKVKDNFILKKIADSYVVIPIRSRTVDFSGVIKLTESASVLWQMLEKGAEREELVARLLEEYEVDDNTAREDVDRFLQKLREADLIE
ncbi:PqqD family protein [Ruminococcus sp.]|uniref:PqqD family protein n=1 Tax=Ruminococcus sp. TaxID=41978 RepID=UPI00388E19A2